MPSTSYDALGGAGATQLACCTELNSLYRKFLIKISPVADTSADGSRCEGSSSYTIMEVV
jgi:hypothetical protein